MKLISQEMRKLAPECAVIKHAASLSLIHI